jgi:DNA-binding HxlR family transcriptional regulator
MIQGFDRPGSPIASAATSLRGRFTLPVLWALFWGAREVEEVCRPNPGLSQRAALAALDELEGRGLVERRPDSTFALSERGVALRPALAALYLWGLSIDEPRPGTRARDLFAFEEEALREALRQSTENTRS